MSLDQRLGTVLSLVLHLAVLAICVLIFRQPFSTPIVAAGEGQGSGEGVIEVGIVQGGQLGFTQPRSVSFVGQNENEANNEVVETVAPKPPDNAEVLPSETKQNKPKEKLTTERPTAKQSEQIFSKKPLQGSSTNTNVEVGRSFGNPVPAMTRGVGVGAGANLGTGGLPGGSPYGRIIQGILSQNYNPPAINNPGETQYVIVLVRIARDGRILSLTNGRLAPSYIKRRSTIDLVNYAAERAIIVSNPLPPFPNGFVMGAQEATAEIWFRYPK